MWMVSITCSVTSKRYDAARNRVFLHHPEGEPRLLGGHELPEMFEPIAGRFLVSVIGSRGEVIFGQPISGRQIPVRQAV